MARNEQQVREYVERAAAILAAAGFPRMPARVLMTLTAAEESQTAADLAESLEASPAAISGAVRYLQTLAMIHRVSRPGSRRDVYELPANSWYTATLAESRVYDAMIGLSEDAVDAAGGSQSDAGARLTELADFFRFVRKRMPEMLAEWAQQRGV
ncbi:GbsR/MarR family transcriptional regulator [Humibacter albus]|uniref:GbsR/MarR family transcriptional regulator n=1 Tax=Humibacter albus TaxID=427754 RepID=UPI0003B53346|nr:MarR family transcriptional regulator [Humibacter albus]